MSHSLILGMTESGKTSFARQLAAIYCRSGFRVLVLDPLMDPQWQCDFISADQEEFLRVFWASRKCMAFLDEGGESVGRYNDAMTQTATRGRHWGHSCHFIAQRALQLAPIVRDQCTHIFLFCSSKKVGEVLADEWNCNELEQCHSLGVGEYIRTSRFGNTYIHRRQERKIQEVKQPISEPSHVSKSGIDPSSGDTGCSGDSDEGSASQSDCLRIDE